MSRRHLPAKWIRDMLPKKCINCGSDIGITYHHIVPVGGDLAGNEIPSNYAVLCGRCHDCVHYGKNEIIDHGYLVSKGIKEAKKRGVHVGKPAADYERVMRLIAERSTQFNEDSLITEHEIMAVAGVKEVCYAKCKRMLLDAMTENEWPYEWSKPVLVRNRPLYEHFIKRLRGETA